MLEIYGVFYGSKHEGAFPRQPFYSDKEDAIEAAKELLEEKKKETQDIWTEEELKGLIYPITHWSPVEDKEHHWENGMYEIQVKTLYVQ